MKRTLTAVVTIVTTTALVWLPTAAHAGITFNALD
jgi:hypothetical protein